MGASERERAVAQSLLRSRVFDPAAGGVRFALQPDKVFLFGRSDEKRIPFALPPL